MANVTVRRVGVLSAAIVSGMFGAVVGMIGGAIYGGLILLGGSIMSSPPFSGSRSGAVGPNGLPFVVIAIGTMIFAPIFYGILSFILGAIYAFIYNVIASIMGGFKMELQADD